MKQQVVFIHGGEAYATYEEFLADMQTWTVDPFVPKKKWRMTLREDLGNNFEVALLEMPNKQNARYSEWKLWMDKHLPFLRDGVILVGHSLGGVFLVRYLCEEKLPVTVRALYLIAAPFFALDADIGGDFRFDEEKLDLLQQKTQEIVVFHAKDDPVVPYEHCEKYKRAFPQAQFFSFEKGGHFIGEAFPELIEDLKQKGG